MECLEDRELGVKFENCFRGLNLSMILENSEVQILAERFYEEYKVDKYRFLENPNRKYVLFLLLFLFINYYQNYTTDSSNIEIKIKKILSLENNKSLIKKDLLITLYRIYSVLNGYINLNSQEITDLHDLERFYLIDEETEYKQSLQKTGFVNIQEMVNLNQDDDNNSDGESVKLQLRPEMVESNAEIYIETKLVDTVKNIHQRFQLILKSKNKSIAYFAIGERFLGYDIINNHIYYFFDPDDVLNIENLTAVFAHEQTHATQYNGITFGNNCDINRALLEIEAVESEIRFSGKLNSLSYLYARLLPILFVLKRIAPNLWNEFKNVKKGKKFDKFIDSGLESIGLKNLVDLFFLKSSFEHYISKDPKVEVYDTFITKISENPDNRLLWLSYPRKVAINIANYVFTNSSEAKRGQFERYYDVTLVECLIYRQIWHVLPALRTLKCKLKVVKSYNENDQIKLELMKMIVNEAIYLTTILGFSSMPIFENNLSIKFIQLLNAFIKNSKIYDFSKFKEEKESNGRLNFYESVEQGEYLSYNHLILLHLKVKETEKVLFDLIR
jgi:hypothetical protein